MKVLTVKQPWANLIIFGGKDIENRTWRTKYRGRVLIHAAKTDDKGALAHYLEVHAVKYDDLVRGAIIGSVEIVDCVSASNSEWFFGPIGWVLDAPLPEKIQFIKGKLGLWNMPPKDPEARDEN